MDRNLQNNKCYGCHNRILIFSHFVNKLLRVGTGEGQRVSSWMPQSERLSGLFSFAKLDDFFLGSGRVQSVDIDTVLQCRYVIVQLFTRICTIIQLEC